MPKANRKCLNCGTAYYVCRSCIDINSWKNVCCCPECYRELMEKLKMQEQVAPNSINVGEVKDMYVILKNSNRKLEVTGYDLNLGRVDTDTGETYTDKDINYIQLTLEELKDIAEQGI